MRLFCIAATLMSACLAAAYVPAQVPEAAPTIPENRVSLGIRVYPVDNPRAQALGVTASAGAVVGLVRADSPAARAGLLAGDVIVKFGDQPTSTVAELEALVKLITVGTTYRVEFYRGRNLYFVDIDTTPAPPPEEWVAKQAGDLMLDVPATWRTMQYLPVDEGAWSLEQSDGTEACVAVVRDLTVEELRGPMTVEAQEKTTLAGRPAESFLGTVQRGEQADRRRVVVIERGESVARSSAVVLLAPAERWASVAPTFDRILASIRTATEPPSESPPVVIPGDLVVPTDDSQL